MKKMSKEERAEWLKGLKAGDIVAISKLSWLRNHYWATVRIEKKTPTGRLNLSDGTIANPDGYLRGVNSSEFIEPLTDEIRETIWRNNTKKRITHYKVDVDKLTDLELKELYSFLVKFPRVEGEERK